MEAFEYGLHLMEVSALDLIELINIIGGQENIRDFIVSRKIIRVEM